MVPTGCKKVEFAPISDIDFRTHKKKSRVESSSSSSSTTSLGIPSPTDDELTRFFSDLLQSGTKSLIPQYCEDYMNNEHCEMVEWVIRSQSNSKLW